MSHLDKLEGRKYPNRYKKRGSVSARTFSSGCNDAFSVFGFLAFLLALLDLIMELNMGDMAAGGGDAGFKRRKRSVSNHHPQMREGTLAAYSMFRGFLNAMDADSSDCSALFVCEAATQAGMRGSTGLSLAKAARYNFLSLSGWGFE